MKGLPDFLAPAGKMLRIPQGIVRVCVCLKKKKKKFKEKKGGKKKKNENFVLNNPTEKEED